MKSLKIGRGSSNDIVLNDPTISSQHAILYTDSNNLWHIKDLNSTNGTFVNNQKVSDEALKPSDIVRLGNHTIDWAKLSTTPSKTQISKNPATFDVGQVQSKTKIGRQGNTNDIVFSHADVSSNHAFLIKNTKGEVWIVDNNSSNGTYVNGSKITKAQLHKGDKILIANKYPLNWERIYTPLPTVRILPIALACAAAVLIAIMLWWKPWKPWEPGMTGKPEEIYAYYDKTVALIYQTYYFEVDVDGETIGRYVFDSDDDIVKLTGSASPMRSFGTGFFVSEDGKIMTNRHVINPYMREQDHIQKLKLTLGMTFEQMALQTTVPAQAASFRHAANNMEVRIEVHSTSIAVNDTYVTTTGDLMPCTILGDTGSDEIDLGLIQLNSKSLPAGSHYVNLGKIDKEIVEGKSIYTIGFPRGLIIGTTSQGIEAQKQSGHVSQNRGNVQFGHNLNIDYGASGSPIFSDKGVLIGVVNAGFLNATGNFNIGIQSQYAAELFNKYN